MSEWLVLVAAAAAAASGLPGLFLSRRSALGQRTATVINAAASALGTWAAVRVFLEGPGEGISLPLPVPGAELAITVDPLSAAFLLPIFVISAMGAVFGEGYWKQSENPRNGRKLRLFYGLLTAGLALLVVARNGVCFLLGWEVMALSAFFAVTTEDDQRDVRHAGWIYFVSTHASTLILFAFFALYYVARGSLRLEPFPAGSISAGTANTLFLLALAGFGLKAGVFPLHFWLPPAHSSAPSHVSALMSGVLIKMGIYGLVRTAWLFSEVPLWWGECLLALGCASGVIGVAYAIGQHDLKRLLAYHSVENIGIICMGLGIALEGRALGRADWVALGLGGAVLHTWNHGLFKALLFLCAGSVTHSVHTREIDRLGGLGKPMPLTSFFFLVGAIAICGLPPLNGLVSELFVYLGLFRAGCGSEESWGMAAFAIPVLGLIGALALACFVKVYGAVFLGTARTEHAGDAREAGRFMIAPMAILAALCGFIGLAPAAVGPALDAVNAFWAPGELNASVPLSTVAPLAQLGWLGAAVLAFCLLGFLALRRRRAMASGAAAVTWDCGYAQPSASQQYTASSFAQMLVWLLGWILFPSVRTPGARGVFPAPVPFHSQVPDAVLDRLLLPVFGGLAWGCSWFRLLQRGKLNAYLFYIFITLLILLLWR